MILNMNNRSLYIILIIICGLGHNVQAQIDFKDVKWETVLRKSVELKKPIFVDVYTNWCAPCKKMDNTTFKNKEVIKFLNEQFISVKWDANHYDYADLAKSYNVKAYPTYLFINGEGQVIKAQSGYQMASSFLELTKGVVDFLSKDQDDAVSHLLNDPHANKEHLEKQLATLNGFHNKNKEDLFRKYFTYLKDKSNLSSIEYDILIDNLSKPYYINFAIQHLPDLAVNDDEVSLDMQTKRQAYKSAIKSKINLNAQTALNRNDFRLLESTTLSNYEFDEKINVNNAVNNAVSENRRWFLEFYQKHNYKEEFNTLASDIVKNEIKQFPPKENKERDKRQFQLQKKYAKGKNFGPNIDSRKKAQIEKRYSYKAASQLYQLAYTLYDFYEDQKHMEKALSWTELSKEYIDLPEARLLRAKILARLGFYDEAKLHLNKGLESKLLIPQIKSEIEKLKSSLERQ